jgi:hypothetical protein
MLIEVSPHHNWTSSPFVYLELFAGQATLQLPHALCPLYRLQIRGRICRGMSRSRRHQVPRIPTSCGSLGRSNNLTRHSSVTSARSASKSCCEQSTPSSSVTRPDVYSALSRDGGDRRKATSPWRRQASDYNTSATMLSRRAARYLCNVIRGSSTVWRPTRRPWKQYPKDEEKVTKRSLRRLWRCSEEPTAFLLPIRCDNVLYPAVKAKNRVRFRPPSNILHLWHTDRQARHQPPH